MNTLRIVIVEPNKAPYIKKVSNTLRALQDIVGGNIETITIPNRFIIVCNEEGRIHSLPLCRILTQNNCEFPLFGTCFLISSSGEEFVSLSEKQIEECIELFSEMNVSL